MQTLTNTRILLPLALAALTTPAFAQTAATAADETVGSGLLGKRYVEAQAYVVDIQNFEDNDFAVGTTVNVPVAASFDVGATFEHTWAEGDETENFQDLSAYATYHAPLGAVRGFARAELGYEWWYVSDDPFYSVAVGAEYAVNDRLSLSGSVGWSEYLAEDWNGGAFEASVRANWWFTDAVAASLVGGAYEGGSWSYGAAAVFRF